MKPRPKVGRASQTMPPLPLFMAHTWVYVALVKKKKIATNLVYGRSRLAPKSKSTDTNMTIPRLELMGAVIGAKTAKFVKNEMQIATTRTTLWLDAKCVLAWITSSRPQQRFVENYVKQIKEIPDQQFRYVTSEDNPADLATRGLTTADPNNNSLW